MAYFNCHALDHASEIVNGYFVSPVTNELMRLTWAESKIAETILRRLPTNEALPWGDQIGYSITNKHLNAWAGKKITPDLYASAILKLELAGIIEVIRELGEPHKIKIGRLLRCDLNQCFEPLHYPGNYPLEKPSTPEVNPSRGLDLEEETPLIALDIKNLNNPLRTLNTLNEFPKDFEPLEIVAAEVAQANELRAVTSELVEPEPLPTYWEEQTWVRARARGLTEPSPADIGWARSTWEETGLDLEPDGAWRDGRARPRPAQELQTGTN